MEAGGRGPLCSEGNLGNDVICRDMEGHVPDQLCDLAKEISKQRVEGALANGFSGGTGLGAFLLLGHEFPTACL